MPAGPLFRINRQLCAFVEPVAEFSAWTGTFSDIDVRRPQVCDPSIPAERQRRTLDEPSQQPVTRCFGEIASAHRGRWRAHRATRPA